MWCIGCASFSEDHYFRSVQRNSNKATNYFRLRIRGNATWAQTRYIAGFYDERAVDLYFNETKTLREGDRGVGVIFEHEQKEPRTKEVIKSLSPDVGHGIYVLILSTNAKSVADTIGEFAEGFVASGMELDITVPFERCGVLGLKKIFKPDKWRIYHPWLASSTVNVRKIDKNVQFITPDEFLQCVVPHSMTRFVYLDVKISEDATGHIEHVLESLLSLIKDALSRNSRVHIAIAAPTDRVASYFIADSESWHSVIDASKRERVSWILEWNDAVSCETVESLNELVSMKCDIAPSAISFMLDLVPDNKHGRDILFRDLDCAQVKDALKLKQPFILWTVKDIDELIAALKSELVTGKVGQVAVMAKNPHQITYWLATHSKDDARLYEQAAK